MAFADHRGVKIHYEVEGQGPALVLQHGLARTLDMWRDFGYVAALRERYRLILIDARGHGGSDCPHDLGAYAAGLMVGDVVAVLDDLGIERAYYYGFSLGAYIGWNIPRWAAPRFPALILQGAARVGEVDEAQRAFRAGLARARLAAEHGAEAAMAAGERAGGQPWPAAQRARFLATDFRALLACLEASEAWPGAGDILAQMTMPCLLITGDVDPAYAGAAECAARMPDAELVVLPGVHHNPAEYQAELVLPHVERFLARAAFV